MANGVMITCKTEPEVKEQARRVLASLGLDMSTAINLFLRQVIRCNGVPFALTAGPTQVQLDAQRIYTPALTAEGVPVLPADWDDPEDAVYDGLYAHA